MAHFEVEVEVFDLDDVFPDKKPPSAASLPASHQLIGIFHPGFVLLISSMQALSRIIVVTAGLEVEGRTHWQIGMKWFKLGN